MRSNSVLITGTGIHSCIATDTAALAHALHYGKCGLRHDPARLARGYQSDLCGFVPDVSDDILVGLTRSQRQCLSQPSLYALAAVRQALREADVDEDYIREKRVSLIASNDSTAEAITAAEEIMRQRGDTRYLGSGAVFRSLNSTVSMTLASILGLHGLSLTLSAACAGGGHALGLAKMLLATGQTDMAIVVGAQETNVYSMQSFDALCVFTADAVRPFCDHRNGLAPSGGAACVVLETERSFTERKAHGEPLAKLSGYGFSTNGHSISSPDVEQEMRSMRNALQDAELSKTDAVLAHATGTPIGDNAEANAIHALLGSAVRVVATKGMTGHECWMAGVSQAVQAVAMMRCRFLPGSVGTLHNPFPIALLRHTVEARPQHVLCNAFGFGGTNSSFVISNCNS